MTTEFSGVGMATTITSDTDDVVLRHLMAADPESLFRIINANRDHLRQFGETLGDHYTSVEEAKNRILCLAFEPFVDRFGIYARDELVGSGSVKRLSGDVAELGVWVGGEHTGRGYATRATSLLAEYSFHAIGVSEVLANIVIGNEASRRTAQKLGFEYVGTGMVSDKQVWQYVLRKAQL